MHLIREGRYQHISILVICYASDIKKKKKKKIRAILCTNPHETTHDQCNSIEKLRLIRLIRLVRLIRLTCTACCFCISSISFAAFLEAFPLASFSALSLSCRSKSSRSLSDFAFASASFFRFQKASDPSWVPYQAKVRYS